MIKDMDFIVSFFGTCVNIVEQVKDWCYYHNTQMNYINFIETNRKEIVFSFDEVDQKKTEYVAVNFSFCKSFYKIIFEVDDDLQGKYDFIMKRSLELPLVNVKSRQLNKMHILSAVAITKAGDTHKITDVMNQPAGPNGDFYEYAEYRFPKDCIIGYLNQSYDKEFQQVSFIDCEGDTHFIQQQ